MGSMEEDMDYLGGMSLSLNPNGTKLAVADFGYLRIFTVPDLELEIAIDENSSLQISFGNISQSNIWPKDAVWSQNGEFLAVGLNEIGKDIPTVTIYDTNNWARIVELSCNSHDVLALDWSQDGTMLACAGDGTVNGIEFLDVWSTPDWTAITTQSLNGLRVNDLAFNSIGSQLAAGGYGDLIQLWNTNDWSNQSFGGEYSDVTSTVSFSRDGELLLTDYVFWIVDDLNRWGEFNLVTHGLFSPFNDEIVTVTFDGDLYNWDSSGWSAAAARGDKPNFKEPESTTLFTLCTTFIVIAIAVLIIIVILVIITVLIIKKKSKRENTF
jgi:WD40 repeat protein